MTTRWERLEQLFADAVALPEAARAGFLDGACDDPSLRAEVEALLAADRAPHAVLGDDAALLATRLAALPVDPAAVAVDRTICDETLASLGGSGRDRGPLDDSLPSLPLAEPGARRTGDPDLAVRGTLGAGGMGQVLLAWQRSVGREVAIKTVTRDAPPALAQALVSEARVAGGLEHPVIPPIHALGRAEDGRPLLVMKRIEGTSWAALLADEAHPAWATVATDAADASARLDAHVRILGRVADAVHFAHGRGYLHRDLKPDNVMLGSDGEVYLVDWGIALPLAEAAAGVELRGTPQYMAPEMVDGRPLDARTDVFLLGATLHRVLTGAPRHQGTTLREVLASARHCPPVAYPAEVPRELVALANAATAAEPADRPPTARAFREALDRYRRHGAAAAVATSALARVEALARRLAGEIDPGDHTLARLVTEARFGLVEAQRLWPDGPEIVRGLARVHRLAIQLELRRGNAAAARALLDGGEGDDDDALRGEVAALERRIAARTAREGRLARLAYDHSPRVGRRALLLGMLLGVVGLLVSTIVAERTGAFGGTAAHVSGMYVVIGAGIYVFAGAIAVAFRRALSLNALARRQVAIAMVTLAAVLAERVLGWRAGSSYAQCATQEFLAVTLGTLAATIFTSWVWLPIAGVALGCVLLLQLWPAHVSLISQGGMGLVVVALAFGAWRTRGRGSHDLEALAAEPGEDRADLP